MSIETSDIDLNIDIVLKTAREQNFLRIVPATDLDSLITASILSKNLEEHGILCPVNTDPKIILDNVDEPLLVINLPAKDRRNLFELKYNGEFSLASYITHYLDRVFGVSKWDKIFSIIAGIYRGLDRGREGFKNIEKEILDELTKTGYIGVDLGLKLWGWKNSSLFKAMYRTLIPFIPGYSGDPQRTTGFLKNVLGIDEIESIKGEQVLSFDETKIDKTRIFIEKLTQSFELVDQEYRSKLVLKLIGYVYTVHDERRVYDIHECLGALEVFSNIDFRNIVYTILLSHDTTILHQALITYSRFIDEVSVEISISIKDSLKKKNSVVEINDLVKRPDIYIDIFESLDLLPDSRPLIIKNNEILYTSLREYIRVNKDFEKAYSKCSEYQICMVSENENLLEAHSI
ncbi:MAG: hypothetical protein QW607_07140 [Desulfurococcaceae archaeon]